MSIKVKLSSENIDVKMNMGQDIVFEEITGQYAHAVEVNGSLYTHTEGIINLPDYYTKVQSDLKYASSALSPASTLNANLLINGDFQIWQRGTTFTNPSNKYTADRFRCNGTGTVSKVSDGMQIAGTINVKYVMEDVDFANIKGKEVTLSYSLDGIVSQNTFTASGTGHIAVLDLNITDQTLNWVKLEQGDSATPFISRLYAEELQLCQRYYERMGLASNTFCMGYFDKTLSFYSTFNVCIMGLNPSPLGETFR